MRGVWAILLLLFGAKSAQAEEPERRPKRYELAVLPAVSVSSDTGVGLGVWSQTTRYLPGRWPYAWMMRLQGKTSIKDGPDGVEFPTHDHFATFDKPGLVGGDLRLYARVGYNENIIAGWYGLGNQTGDDKQDNPRRFQYRRLRPFVGATARYIVWEKLSAFFDLDFRFTRSGTYEGSRLEEDIAASESGDGERLYGYRDHFLAQAQLGAIWDSRDHETNPTKGWFTELSLRGSPGGLTGADHDYVGMNFGTRTFLSLYQDYLVFGVRLMSDVLQGNVPYYFLAESKGLRSMRVLGSELGVRGVPTQRYNGKVKVLGSAELRAVFYRFQLVGEHFALGASAFADSGRVWYDLTPHPELDGTGVGLKYGVGGGPQIHWGENLVIRVDTAYSPDANPIGFYLEAGRPF